MSSIVQDAPKYTPMSEIVAELESEAKRIGNGFIELRVYVTNNVPENHDITTHKRNKGRIALSATN